MSHTPHEFDQYAKNYRENLDKNLWLSGESSTFFAEYKAQKLKQWLPELANKPITILDFGCGDGVMTSFVQAVFPQATVVGADPSSESIEVARMAYEKITFQVSDTRVDMPDQHFDLIFAAGAFHHIPFNEHEHYRQEVMRLLKPGGIFVMFELNPYNPLTVWTFKHNPIDQNATMMRPGYSYKLLRPAGSVTTKFYCFFPHALRKLRFFEPYLTKVPVGALYACVVKKNKD
jgi:ubiquinone/menaquinone biosynthesis C-methylase UbiE